MSIKQAPAAPLPSITPEMSEIEAGEAFSSYINRVGGDDIDVFSSENVLGTAEPASSSEPEGDTDPPAPRQEAADGDDEDAASADSEDEEETGEEADDSDDADAEEGIEPAELAAMLGLDDTALSVDDDGNVRVRYKVDGETGTATLTELLKGYQLEANTTRKSQQLSEERQAARHYAEQQREQLGQAIQQAGAFAEAMKGRVLARYEQVDWNRLREEDPGEYSALYTQMQQEMQSIDHEVANLQSMAQQHVQQAQAERSAYQQAWAQEEQKRLFAALPELADPEGRKPLITEYQDYLTGYGFSNDEIKGILDHRLMRVIHDASRYHLGQTKKLDGGADPVPVKKRLRKVPRVVKGGSSSPEKTRKQTTRTRSLRRLSQSGSDTDAARFAIESGIVDSML